MSYPKWIYHETLDAKIVNSKEEHEACGKGWEETPAAFDKKQNEKTEKPTASENEKVGTCEGSELKELNLIALTVAELKKILIEKGKKESELKGLKKDDLIALIGACK